MQTIDAVNIIIGSIGEAPIASLPSDLLDAQIAETILDEVRLTVLTKGWHINTIRKRQLAKDGNGKIDVPAGTLRIDTTYTDAWVDAIPKYDGATLRLYDIENDTFVWTRDLWVTIVEEIDFEKLPHFYQDYIAIMAAEMFQERTLGSAALSQFLTLRRDSAWAAMLDGEAEGEDANVLRDSSSVRRTVWRYNQLYGQ